MAAEKWIDTEKDKKFYAGNNEVPSLSVDALTVGLAGSHCVSAVASTGRSGQAAALETSLRTRACSFPLYLDIITGRNSTSFSSGHVATASPCHMTALIQLAGAQERRDPRNPKLPFVIFRVDRAKNGGSLT